MSDRVKRWMMSAAVVLLAATPSRAQAVVEIFGGAAVITANNGSGEFALPTDGTVMVPTFGGAVGVKDRRLGVQVEVSLPRNMTKESPGSIKSGPVVYVVTRRDLIASFLVRVHLIQSGRASVNGHVGLSAVTSGTGVRYSFEEATDPPTRTYSAVSTGVDLVFDLGRSVFLAPRLRLHYTTGIQQAGFGPTPGAVLVAVGAALGWRF